MMKKWMIFLFSAAVCLHCWALPRSFEAAVGNLKLRFDGNKRCNMNRVEYKGELVGVDDRGFHYGTVLFVKGEKGFVGSGHTDAGYGEVVDRLEVRVDGRLVEAAEGARFAARKCFQLRKLSHIGHFQVDYTLDVMDDELRQSVWITSDAELEMKTIYPLIQPWSTRFTRYFARQTDGTMRRSVLQGKGAFPVDGPGFETLACYDDAAGIGVVTRNLGGAGQCNPSRCLWDRHVYRKDYLSDFSEKTFPKGHIAHYTSLTVFFVERDAARWEQSALRKVQPEQ